MPTLSIILPTFNRATLIKAVIENILSQTYQDFELIIVDDASDDDTREIVVGFLSERIRYVRHEVNKGPAAARNTGCTHARGDFIGFQDSDDHWLADKLETQMAVFAEHDEADLVFSNFIKKHGDAETSVPDSSQALTDGDIKTILLFRNIIGTPTVIMKKELFALHGGFDETMHCYEDWDLWLGLSNKATFFHVPVPLVLSPYTPHGVNDQPLEVFAEATLKIVENHPAEYEANRAAKAHMLQSVGALYCQSGNVEAGRQYILKAVQINPLALRNVAALGLSLLGSRAYVTVSQIKRRLTGLMGKVS